MAPPLVMLAALAVQPPTSTLVVELEGLRNGRGLIQACLMADRARFPNCAADPHAVRQSVRASPAPLVFTGVKPGDYALVLFHDENANNRLDTILGIPREGFGFSRNPIVRFGAPRYDRVNMKLAPGVTRVRVRLQYLL